MWQPYLRGVSGQLTNQMHESNCRSTNQPAHHWPMFTFFGWGKPSSHWCPDVTNGHYTTYLNLLLPWVWRYQIIKLSIFDTRQLTSLVVPIAYWISSATHTLWKIGRSVSILYKYSLYLLCRKYGAIQTFTVGNTGQSVLILWGNKLKFISA